MAGKSNDLSLGLVVIVSLPLIICAFPGPPLFYWNHVSENTPASSVPIADITNKEAGTKYKFYNTLEDSVISQEKRGTWFLKNVGAKHMGEEKRGSSLSLVTFSCTRKNAFCKNGGRGPKLTKTGTGVLCVCMCPYGYLKPNCEQQWWSRVR